MPERSLIHPRQELVDTLDRIYRYRMTTTSGGNLSIRDEVGDVWITPARVDKGSLRPDDVVCCRAGGTFDGRHRPSSELPFHQAIYAARPDLGAVVHAHPVALVAFSACRTMPDTKLFPQAWHVCGPVAFAPYALPGSAKLGKNIADVFATGVDCVMLENHGVVVGGADLQQAFRRFETLEFNARTAVRAARLGSVRSLNDAQLEQSKRPRSVLDAFEPAPASTAEKEARRLVAEFVRRGYRQRLLTSTEGTFSARVGDGDEFVITSYDVDRAAATAENLTLVRGGRREAGKRPSRAAEVHRAIYAKHPTVRAICNAMPINAAAFGIVPGATLDARVIPESYLFLRDVVVAPFGAQYGDPAQLASLVGPDRPVVLMENDGALVIGTSVLDAFDRLEVLEATAEAVIDAGAVGPVCPMGDADITELMVAFCPKAKA
ncbi:MAG TPA: class II aldolase/adducin family protein [Tepidisphaeraceae bacterium]|nr:class II aldolase/adducin family protein [Tepidisphaeraceae bacterium]